MSEPSTVFEAFSATARSHPDNLFIIVPSRPGRAWLPDGCQLTYGQVFREVERQRERYAQAGYGHGHRVALLLDMRPEFIVHYLALNALGAGIVPVNPDYRHDEMLYQMEHSEALLGVSLPERMADLERVAAALPHGLPIVDGLQLGAALPVARFPAPKPMPPDLETETGLLYTSGTTGRPKGCILSNHYYLNAGRGYAGHGGCLTLRFGEERIYNPLPLFHMNMQAVTLTCVILTANCVILPERFSPNRWWQEIVQTGATAIHYLGVVPPLLLNQPPSEEEKRHKVRFGLGAGLDPELHPVFEKRFGFPLIEVWGMTETGRVFADNLEPRQVLTRAFGRPYAGFEARVVDDDMNDVPLGQDGELVVRHSEAEPRKGFFSGYFKNEQATAEAWRGGWFHTGDVVRQAEDGMLYFVDRRKNIIRRSGENIAAAEVEAALQVHEAVAQVAVMAVEDELREEEVMACIVLKPGTAPGSGLAQILFAHCMARLAYFKAPGWVIFVERLPTTGTQKVQKGQIFASGEDPRRRPDAHDFRSMKKRSA